MPPQTRQRHKRFAQTNQDVPRATRYPAKRAFPGQNTTGPEGCRTVARAEVESLDLTGDGAAAFDLQITEPADAAERPRHETIGAHDDLDRRVLLRQCLYRPA